VTTNTPHPAGDPGPPTPNSRPRWQTRVTAVLDAILYVDFLLVFHSLRLPLYAARLLHHTFRPATWSRSAPSRGQTHPQ
jgi:hypothetical protein